MDDLDDGRQIVEEWLTDRFPEATIKRLGPEPGGHYERWLVDFGDRDIGIGATSAALRNVDGLKAGIARAEQGTWLEGDHQRFVISQGGEIFDHDRNSW